MQAIESKLPVEVLMISFDGYADVWGLSIPSFFKFWPDCPYKFNLLTNEKEYEDPRVRSLKAGRDENWSSNLIRGLQKINSPYVLTLFDDFILKEKIDHEKLNRLIELCIKNKFNYFRLRPSPPPDGNETKEYGSLRPGAPYRVSLCTAIVKKETLLNLLEPGESAWDFEKFGTLRSAQLPGFYSAKEQLIPYYNAIEKGKWNDSVIPILEQHNIPTDERGKYAKSEKTPFISHVKHFIVFSLMPVFIRKLFYRSQKIMK